MLDTEQYASRQSYFAFGEYIRTLRLTSELVDLRVGYAKRIQELRS